MEIQRQSEQWGHFTAERKPVSYADVRDMLTGKEIPVRTAGGAHRAPDDAPALNRPDYQGKHFGPDPVHHEVFEPVPYDHHLRGPSMHLPGNQELRDLQGTPTRAPNSGDRGLGDVAWAQQSPGFDLEQDYDERTRAAQDYARQMFEEEPYTIGERNLDAGPTEFYNKSFGEKDPDSWYQNSRPDPQFHLNPPPRKW